MKKICLPFALLSALVLGAGAACAQTPLAVVPPVPLTNAHAHNDYEHTRPLFEALDNGFCSVEADIYLVDGELLVAHNRNQVRKERTLQSLYLDPLRARVKANGGRVYRGGPPVTLLVDIKADSTVLYPVLRKVLASYRDILTHFTDKGMKPGAITVILSGDRPIKLVAAEKERLCGIDGRLENLDMTPPVSPYLYPLVSQDWGEISQWNGQGELPAADRAKLADAVTKAHEQGIKIRFWATPDNPTAWGTLRDAGVDYLNADDLAGLRVFLTGPRKAPVR